MKMPWNVRKTALEAGFLRSYRDQMIPDAPLPSPYLLDGFEEGLQCLEAYLTSNQSIVVYGDYDVDGICAVSIWMLCFKQLRKNASYYIPHRMEEGYGLNLEAVKKLADAGHRLLLSVDCGISSTAEVDQAQRLGMEVMITDHHQCPPVLPCANVIINPHKPSSSYPFKSLCGATLAALMATELMRRQGQAIPRDFLELSCIAIIADMMELQGPNRLWVKEMIQQTASDGFSNLGLNALCKVSSLKMPLDSSAVAFGLAPRINSAGRMGKSKEAVSLLTACDPAFADEKAHALQRLNEDRRKIQQEIYLEALAQCQAKDSQGALVVAKEGWHSGVTGIVASKLTETFSCPSVVIAIEGDVGKASCRSVDSFNLFACLQELSALFIKFGGHEMAAGFTLAKDNIALFEDRFVQAYQTWKENNTLCQSMPIDFHLPAALVNDSTYEDLKNLEPFGNGNPKPVFLISGVQLQDAQLMGKEKNHFKASVPSLGQAIGFYQPHWMSLALKEPVDIVFELDQNEFRGSKKLQLLIKDMRSSPCMDPLLQSWEAFLGGQPLVISGSANRLLVSDDPRILYALMAKHSHDTPGVPFSTLFLPPDLDQADSAIVLKEAARFTKCWSSFKKSGYSLCSDQQLFDSSSLCLPPFFEQSLQPSRALFVKFYSAVRRAGRLHAHIQQLQSFFGTHALNIVSMLSVLESEKALSYQRTNDWFTCDWTPQSNRFDLSSNDILQKTRNLEESLWNEE